MTPRGSVPRLRPDLGLDEQGQDRRQEGRHASSPPRAPSSCRPAPSPARRSAAPPAAPSRPTTSPTSLSVGYDVVSNRSKVAAYRAPGAPIGAYAVECVLDELAEKLKMDPIELRLKNAAKQGTKADARPGLSAHRLSWRRWKRRTHIRTTRRRSASQPGPRRGLGLLVQRRRRIERRRSTSTRTARSWSSPAIPTSAARAPRIANIAAELLGIDYKRVTVLIGDTEHDRLLQPDRRQPRHLRLRHGGHAVAAKVIADLQARAAKIWKIDPDAVELGKRRGQPGRRQCRQVRAAVAGRSSPRTRRRPAARSAPASSSTPRAPKAASAPISATSRSTANRQRPGAALHRDPGRRPRDPSELCRGPDAGRRRPGHRLGAQRGVHLRQGRQAR